MSQARSISVQQCEALFDQHRRRGFGIKMSLEVKRKLLCSLGERQTARSIQAQAVCRQLLCMHNCLSHGKTSSRSIHRFASVPTSTLTCCMFLNDTSAGHAFITHKTSSRQCAVSPGITQRFKKIPGGRIDRSCQLLATGSGAEQK